MKSRGLYIAIGLLWIVNVIVLYKIYQVSQKLDKSTSGVQKFFGMFQ